jgi:hypothetical protein
VVEHEPLAGERFRVREVGFFMPPISSMNGMILRPKWLLTLVTLAGIGSCSAGADERGDGVFRWTISTAVEVDAPASRVWDVLVDLPAYPQWNPFIVKAEGKVAVGETLSLRMALPGWEPITIQPRLLVVEPERELRWKGRLLVPGLFDGEHAFVLTPLENGRTRLDHSERFAGLLLPIARGMVYDATVQSFHALDAALAKRAADRASAGAAESWRQW